MIDLPYFALTIYKSDRLCFVVLFVFKFGYATHLVVISAGCVDWDIELLGVGRVCLLRLHPDRTELDGVSRVCLLRLHPDQADVLKV